MHIVQNAVDIARLLGVAEPKVAALSAVEIVNPAISSTIDAACLAKMADRGQIEGAIVDGPLAFDNAISAESAKVKGITSPVSGDVDILMVPELVSGNILGKDLEYLAGAQLAGFVVGTKVPIILTSRSDPPRARLISCAVATLASHRME
jgi:phosphotransacetylase